VNVVLIEMTLHRKSRKSLSPVQTFMGRGDRLPSILFPFGRPIEREDSFIDFVVRITLPRETKRETFRTACDRLFTKVHEADAAAARRKLSSSAAWRRLDTPKQYLIADELKVSPATLSRALQSEKRRSMSRKKKRRAKS